MNFFNFGQPTEDDQKDVDISLNSVEPSICLEPGQLNHMKQIEVNSLASSVVQLDDSSNDDAESIDLTNLKVPGSKQT